MSFHSSERHTVREEERSLFLGDLSCFCQDDDIYHFFRMIGEIEAIRLMRDKFTNRCSGYGFITFKEKNVIPVAMRLNGQVLLGRRIKIGLANPRKKSSSAVGGRGIKLTSMTKEIHPGDGDGGAHRKTRDNSKPPAQLHFSYLTHQMRHLVTEETIRGIFSQFGDVVDVMIKKNVCLDGFGQSGYGFVYFPLNLFGIEAAIRAASAITRVMIDGVLYDSYLARSLEASLQTAGLLENNTINPPLKPNELPVTNERTQLSAHRLQSYDGGLNLPNCVFTAATNSTTSTRKEETGLFGNISRVADFNPTQSILTDISLLRGVSLPVKYENSKSVSSNDQQSSFN